MCECECECTCMWERVCACMCVCGRACACARLDMHSPRTYTVAKLNPTNTVRQVLGMAALIGAYPYDVPEWMPEVLVQLVWFFFSCVHVSRSCPQISGSLCVSFPVRRLFVMACCRCPCMCVHVLVCVQGWRGGRVACAASTMLCCLGKRSCLLSEGCR